MVAFAVDSASSCTAMAMGGESDPPDYIIRGNV